MVVTVNPIPCNPVGGSSSGRLKTMRRRVFVHDERLIPSSYRLPSSRPAKDDNNSRNHRLSSVMIHPIRMIGSCTVSQKTVTIPTRFHDKSNVYQYRNYTHHPIQISSRFTGTIRNLRRLRCSSLLTGQTAVAPSGLMRSNARPWERTLVPIHHAYRRL